GPQPGLGRPASCCYHPSRAGARRTPPWAVSGPSEIIGPMARTYRLGPFRQGLNSLMTSLIRAGLGGPSNYLLTTVGRRTGRMRTTPITVLENADGRWLVSPYGNVGWVYNVRANPEITLQRGNRTETLQAEEVP